MYRPEHGAITAQCNRAIGFILEARRSLELAATCGADRGLIDDYSNDLQDIAQQITEDIENATDYHGHPPIDADALS